MLIGDRREKKKMGDEKKWWEREWSSEKRSVMKGRARGILWLYTRPGTMSTWNTCEIRRNLSCSRPRVPEWCGRERGRGGGGGGVSLVKQTAFIPELERGGLLTLLRPSSGRRLLTRPLGGFETRIRTVAHGKVLCPQGQRAASGPCGMLSAIRSVGSTRLFNSTDRWRWRRWRRSRRPRFLSLRGGGVKPRHRISLAGWENVWPWICVAPLKWSVQKHVVFQFCNFFLTSFRLKQTYVFFVFNRLPAPLS